MCRWIPLRLNLEERKLLRLLEAALNVSEYTDKVDVLTYRSKTQRIHAQLKDICAILSGLLVASDYRKGQKLLVDRNFRDNEGFFQVGPPLCLPLSCISYCVSHLLPHCVSHCVSSAGSPTVPPSPSLPPFCFRMCSRWGGGTK